MSGQFGERKCECCGSPSMPIKAIDGERIYYTCGSYGIGDKITWSSALCAMTAERNSALLERDKYRRVLELIRDYGGKSDGESGLSMNGSWCAEQANTVLCPKGEDTLDLGLPASWYAMGNENTKLSGGTPAPTAGSD